jgi:hypothetical protein
MIIAGAEIPGSFAAISKLGAGQLLTKRRIGAVLTSVEYNIGHENDAAVRSNSAGIFRLVSLVQKSKLRGRQCPPNEVSPCAANGRSVT